MDNVNSSYNTQKIREQIKEAYDQNNTFKSVILQKIFTDAFVNQIEKHIQNLSPRRKYQADSHSYSTTESKELTQLLNAQELNELLQFTINKSIKNLTWTYLEFEQQDYTILNDTTLDENAIDIIIDITQKWDTQSGGNLVYVDGVGDYSNIPPSYNTLIIADRQNGNKRFMQYVNHYAKNNKRRLLIATIRSTNKN